MSIVSRPFIKETKAPHYNSDARIGTIFLGSAKWNCYQISICFSGLFFAELLTTETSREIGFVFPKQQKERQNNNLPSTNLLQILDLG